MDCSGSDSETIQKLENENAELLLALSELQSILIRKSKRLGKLEESYKKLLSTCKNPTRLHSEIHVYSARESIASNNDK